MLAYLLLLLIGIVSATFGSIVGLGGGIIIVPALIYIGPHLLDRDITTAVAVGTSLTVLIVTALASTLTYLKRGTVDFRSGWLYFATSGPAAVAGASLTGLFPQATFQLAFGCFMLFMAGLMVARDYLKPVELKWRIRRTFTDASGHTWEYGYSVIPALFVGLGVGLISGLFGIGGGSLFVPVMVLLFAYPPHVATATSMFVIFLSAILGSATHVAAGEIDWPSVAALAPGAWLGGWLGARIASRMSGRGLLWLLRATLFVLSLRLIADGIGLW
ncbi:sulfite exporter TauE/SafE family protein [Paenibacillus cymbidii]|uniref:sulfite exporter TauE/SafE family protein n=1 Tax=Paenibacillus cymbidii TaxID=1639034 RepID=UPI00108144F8|nr:sulfite exporter TauE/SafE family protein [Paenibacillus cymbidii]